MARISSHILIGIAGTTSESDRLRGDLEILPQLAEDGLARAAKDISMGGILGTLLMLLECSGVGASIDLDRIPKPGILVARTLAYELPSYGYLFAVVIRRASPTSERRFARARHRERCDRHVRGRGHAARYVRRRARNSSGICGARRSRGFRRMHARDGLRIALFTYSTQPRGGVLHALALAEALCDAGHEAVLYALDDTERGFIRAPPLRVRARSRGAEAGAICSLTFGVASRSTSQAWDPATPPFDVYHAHDGISGNALATLVERGSIPSYVRTVHHLDDFEAAPMAALQDRAVRSAERCFVVSDVWRRRLAATYGIDATIVPNGVDVERFSPVSSRARAELREQLGYGDGPLFLSIGGIEARKNALATLEAFARVRERHPNAPARARRRLRAFSITPHIGARSMRASPNSAFASCEDLTVTGVLRDDEIVVMLRAAHAFVFPSLVEGFGLVLLEALACGTPVVTSAIAPFDEFLTSDDALLVDPRDPAAIASAMLQSLEPGVAATTAMRGPALARRFAWSASARAHVAAYLAATDREVATCA